MKSIATFLSSYLVAHILLISIIEAYFCTQLKLVELGFIFLVFGIAVVNSKKIIIEKSDITIVFLLVFFNIYYTFIESRGLIFFQMTYVLFLAIILSKVILPNISLKRYLAKINTVYLIVLIGLVIEYLILLFIGDVIFTDLFECHGARTGVRGYTTIMNITSGIIPLTGNAGLNSIMMGSQSASQLAVIIFIWYLYKYKASEKRNHLALGLLAIIMLMLSPSLTSLLLLFISIAIIYLVYLISTYKEEIRNFYKVYIVIFIVILSVYFLMELLLYRYFSLEYIYEKYFVSNLAVFGYFDLKEILFGIPPGMQEELFTVTEIAFLTQFSTYGLLGVGVFYISIFYYIFRALGYGNTMVLMQNIVILLIFILGNIHYQFMFGTGVMELFVLHLAYIIYQGSCIKNN